MLTSLHAHTTVTNRFPRWKYVMLIVIALLGFIYALPNFFGEDPAIQIAGNAPGVSISAQNISQIKAALTKSKIAYKSITQSDHFVQVRFRQLDLQLPAKEAVEKALGDQYAVALSLAPATPSWLAAVGGNPMKLGLDLRGGVHFLLNVDVASVVKRRLTGEQMNMAQELRNANLRYSGYNVSQDAVILTFRLDDTRGAAATLLRKRFPDFEFTEQQTNNQFSLVAKMRRDALIKAQAYVIDQTMTTLRNRIDELGISDPVVQQQGLNRISVDLPGVQDASQAKKIVGGTATLEFNLVDERHNASDYMGRQPPYGTRLYKSEGRHYLFKNQVILHGSSITSASASFGEDGRPNVNIRLGGGGEALWNRATRQNIGHLMGTVYVETKTIKKRINGKKVTVHKRIERVINVATINGALGNSFQIMGLSSQREATNLALLLRAGALPANIDFAQERTVGPSLGKDNIKTGMMSVVVGFILVVVFMTIYYRLFGFYANVALLMNLVLTVAILSILGMVLTLPGIAGIVLNMGMAVDANVLIFERIREELRNGVSPQASIHAGYDRAFTTIVDANITTLIAAMALFGIGSGPVKGFAVTLTIGILTSMLTAITGTRALVNLTYGGKNVKKLSIGI